MKFLSRGFLGGLGFAFLISLVACDLGKAVEPETAPTAASPIAEPPPHRDPVMEQGARAMALINEYRSRLEEKPNDLEALVFLGNANFDIGQFGEAEAYYRRALAIDSKNVNVRTDLATALRQTGRLDEAIAELESALVVRPNHDTALFNLGWMLVNDKNDYERGAKLWERLLAAHPDYKQAEAVREALPEVKKRRNAAPAAKGR